MLRSGALPRHRARAGGAAPSCSGSRRAGRRRCASMRATIASSAAIVGRPSRRARRRGRPAARARRGRSGTRGRSCSRSGTRARCASARRAPRARATKIPPPGPGRASITPRVSSSRTASLIVATATPKRSRSSSLVAMRSPGPCRSASIEDSSSRATLAARETRGGSGVGIAACISAPIIMSSWGGSGGCMHPPAGPCMHGPERSAHAPTAPRCHGEISHHPMRGRISPLPRRAGGHFRVSRSLPAEPTTDKEWTWPRCASARRTSGASR